MRSKWSFQFSKTKYILIADFEHLFSKGFEHDVLSVAQETLQNSSRILVYRVFEIEHGEKEPETKRDLEKLMNDKKAVIFHGAYYPAHAIPNLKEWFSENTTRAGISIENIT